MSPAFTFLILLVFGHSIHDSSAARVRSSNLQITQHVAEHDDVDRNTNSTNYLSEVTLRNSNSPNNRITIVSDRTDRDLSHTSAEREEDVRHFVAATWHRVFKEASSMTNAAVSRVGGTVFALYLYCAFIALALLVLFCLCLCSSGQSREGKSRKAANKSKASSNGKAQSNSGRTGQLQIPGLPIPGTRSYHQFTTQPSSEHFTTQPSTFPFTAQQSQQPFAAQPTRKVIDFGEVIARLSRTIKKVPTGHISYNVHRWVGIGPQERHFAVWWGVAEHTWATARFGWWKSKQDHLERKPPKGDLALKDVSTVRLIEHDSVSDPGVSITRADGVDDLLLFFQSPGVAEQYAKDLLLLVGKVKGAIKAESVIRKQQGKQQ